MVSTTTETATTYEETDRHHVYDCRAGDQYDPEHLRAVSGPQGSTRKCAVVATIGTPDRARFATIGAMMNSKDSTTVGIPMRCTSVAMTDHTMNESANIDVIVLA